MPGSKQVKSIADQIQDALWLCVSPRRNALDDEKLELQNDVRRIIRQRDPVKMAELLELIGKGPNTDEGKRLMQMFKTLFDLDQQFL
jgi:hypothetical protein